MARIETYVQRVLGPAAFPTACQENPENYPNNNSVGLALKDSRKYAGVNDAKYISSLHVFLGILTRPTHLVSRVLNSKRKTAHGLFRKIIDDLLEPCSDRQLRMMGGLKYGRSTKDLFRIADKYRGICGERLLTTEHLLYAFLDMPKTVPYNRLNDLGIDRAHVARLAGHPE